MKGPLYHLWIELLRGRLFNHPIHAMLVHFPSALFPTAVFFDFFSYLSGNLLFSLAAFYLFCIAIGSGCLAAVFGAIDYSQISPEKKAWKEASWHASLTLSILVLFALITGMKFRYFPYVGSPSLVMLLLEGMGIIGIIVANYLGGDLVYTQHIGLNKNSDTDTQKIDNP